jgi:hypothetical protein
LWSRCHALYQNHTRAMASKSTTYTLTLTVDAIPSRIAWYVKDTIQSVTLAQSNKTLFSQLNPYATINQTFALPDDQTFYFFFENNRASGIKCLQPECYRLINQNSTDSSPLFIGDGRFTCLQRFSVGVNAPRLQNPFNGGCTNSIIFRIPFGAPDVIIYQVLLIIFGLFVLSIIVWRLCYAYKKRTREREVERRVEQDRELDVELQRKLQDAKKESILSILPQSVRCTSYYLA